MLVNAKQILVSELALVKQSDTEHIEEIVDERINYSYLKNIAPEVSIDESESNPLQKFIPFD